MTVRVKTAYKMPSPKSCHFLASFLSAWVSDYIMTAFQEVHDDPDITAEERKAMKKLMVSMRLIRKDPRVKVSWSFLFSCLYPVVNHHNVLEMLDHFVEVGRITEQDYLEICNLLKAFNGTAESMGFRLNGAMYLNNCFPTMVALLAEIA